MLFSFAFISTAIASIVFQMFTIYLVFYMKTTHIGITKDFSIKEICNLINWLVMPLFI